MYAEVEAVAVCQPQQRSGHVRRENWAQFELGDPEIEAGALSELEASFGLKRGWNVDGAANVYFRSKGALAAVGQDVVQGHRFRHRRRARDACRKTCAARDLYAYCLLCLPTDLHPRVMPISPLLGPLIAKALDYDFAGKVSFHREVARDLGRLRIVLDKPARERSPAEKSLVLRYAGTASVLRERPNTAKSGPYHRTI
jgi:hypothetical protein